jgi:hypothetical protein
VRVADLAAQAAALPADLRLTLRTPLRVKARGAFIEQLDLPAIVQAACWRLAALAAFHGDPWEADYRPLVAVFGHGWVELSHCGATGRTQRHDTSRMSRATYERVKIRTAHT